VSAAETIVHHRIPKLLPWQREVITWEPEVESGLIEAHVLSPAWSTGKSFTQAGRACRLIMEEGRPGANAIVLGPTLKNLEQTLMPFYEVFLPSAFIRTKRKPHGVHEWVLQNGVHLHFWSFRGLVDSIGAFLVHIDEVQEREVRDPFRWGRIVQRLRGPEKRKHLLTSGIAIDDQDFRKRFDKPDDPSVRTWLPGLMDSWSGLHEPWRLKLAVEGREKRVADAILHGGWIPPAQSAFPNLVLEPGEDSNLSNVDPRPWVSGERDVVLALDPGEQFGSAIIARTKTPSGEDALLALESHTFDRFSSEQVVQWYLAETDYRITTVVIDTDSVRDSRVLIRQALPQAEILSITKHGSGYARKTKLERFRWAICDGAGTRRFYVHERMLDEGKRALVHLLRTAKLKENGELTRPNDEHVRDCAIYATFLLLKPKAPTPDYSDASQEMV